MQPLLTQLLNLPGIEVEDYSNCGGQLILEVEVVKTQATCPRCQQVSCNLHQNHCYLARDFSISGQTVFLKVNAANLSVEPVTNLLVKHLILLAIGENKRTALLRQLSNRFCTVIFIM